MSEEDAQMAVASQTAVSGVRDITAEEVAFFADNGWATLRGLLSPDLTAGLLERAKRLMGEDGGGDRREGRNTGFWSNFVNPNLEDELFASFLSESALGRNAAVLLGRDSSIRNFANMLAVKLPAGSSPLLNNATPMHQDALGPTELCGLNFWIALDEATRQQGTLQYRTGSHKLGPLGGDLRRGVGVSPETWPRLAELPVTEPQHLQAGDATVHHNFTVHAANANEGDRPRWAYLCPVFPGDARYIGYISDPDGPIDASEYPLMYAP
jgi:hypothetical protein